MKLKSLASAIILVVFLAWLGYYGYNHRGDFAGLTLANPSYLILLIAIFLVSYLAIAVINNELLRALHVVMPLGESFMLSVVTGFYNLITPFRGGMAVRAVYLKKRYDFAYVNFLASLSAVYVLTFLVASLLGIVSTLWIYSSSGTFSWILFFVFAAVFLGMLGIIFVSPQFKERENVWLNRFIKVINGWHLIKKNARVIFVTSVITLIQILLGSWMMWLQFRVFGLDVSFMAAIFLSAIGSLSLLIGLTPGNLGVQEAVVVFSASTIGISTAESLSAALLGRAVGLVVLFALGPIFSWMLMKKRGVSRGISDDAISNSHKLRLSPNPTLSATSPKSPNKIVKSHSVKSRRKKYKLNETRVK